MKPNKEDSFKVKIAFAHQAICWPGVCGSEKTLSQLKIPGVEMTLAPLGLILIAKGQRAIVPHQNIANYVLED
jgi:hypothetical protein